MISVMSSRMWMRIFIGWLEVPLVPANLMAVALTSAANFLFGDPWVFQRP
jgi:putative flippase GtrA